MHGGFTAFLGLETKFRCPGVIDIMHCIFCTRLYHEPVLFLLKVDRSSYELKKWAGIESYVANQQMRMMTAVGEECGIWGEAVTCLIT